MAVRGASAHNRAEAPHRAKQEATASALQLFLSAAAEDIAQRELKLARVVR